MNMKHTTMESCSTCKGSATHRLRICFLLQIIIMARSASAMLFHVPSIKVALIPFRDSSARSKMYIANRRWNQFIPYHPYIVHPAFRLFGRQRTPKRGASSDIDDGDDDIVSSPPSMKSVSMTKSSNKTMKKENFPSKICVVCHRPFTWRKKWERSWDEITTCSKKCNGERRSGSTK